jgi:hypothetical protein
LTFQLRENGAYFIDILGKTYAMALNSKDSFLQMDRWNERTATSNQQFLCHSEVAKLLWDVVLRYGNVIIIANFRSISIVLIPDRLSVLFNVIDLF